MEDFRPISCVNTIYKIHAKIHAKILANCLAQVTPFLLSNNQAAFTHDKHISNQYKMTKKMVNGFNWWLTMKRFCMMVDLCKGFDTIDWEVNKTTLKCMVFQRK